MTDKDDIFNFTDNSCFNIWISEAIGRRMSVIQINRPLFGDNLVIILTAKSSITKYARVKPTS
jgi:hypothetical protein